MTSEELRYNSSTVNAVHQWKLQLLSTDGWATCNCSIQTVGKFCEISVLPAQSLDCKLFKKTPSKSKNGIHQPQKIGIVPCYRILQSPRVFPQSTVHGKTSDTFASVNELTIFTFVELPRIVCTIDKNHKIILLRLSSPFAAQLARLRSELYLHFK